MNKVITKIRSGIGGYLKDNILFLTFVFASVLNGFLLRAFTVKFNYSQIKPLHIFPFHEIIDMIRHQLIITVDILE